MSSDLTPIDAELARTTELQGQAADPAASVWVSANAGTGKTHVLTKRVLRLLLAGTAPERILCLTFTKAAAAEMSKRVFESLATWVMLPQTDLERILAKDFLGRDPSPAEAALARTLFTRATETPGGLGIVTIHAFAERLLQRFPLEAGVTPGFSILDDATAKTLMREAIDQVIGVAARERHTQLGRALSTAVAYAADDRFDEILTDAVNRRDWLEGLIRRPAETESGADGFEAAEQLYRRHFGVRSGITRDAIEANAASALSESELAHVRDVLRGGTASDVKCAEQAAAALASSSDRARMQALCGLLLTKDYEPRKRLVTKALGAKNPEIEPMMQRAQSRLLSLVAEHQGVAVVDATMALLRLADAVLQRYADAKVRRAALDFEDLIQRAQSLLANSSSVEWVLYKLDRGLDHILVDESQDTSPSQWRVVEAIAGEFFSGAGARDDVVRTLFAVGDEKQSIYSFQGAAPEMFSSMGDRFETLTQSAGATWRRIPLTLSFRTVSPVLDAVDRVFADETRTPGVKPAPHAARRAGHAGLVEIWDTEQHDDAAPADVWAPLDEQAGEPPTVRLANRIANTIKGWIDSGERLQSAGRPIAPGDILILVQKRNPFAAPMVQALKARRIPVAGADRMRLTEQIAIQDMLSLGDFLTLPEDDLALAEVLKSPIFCLDDADLEALAFRGRETASEPRRGTLWKALLDASAEGDRFVEAAETLKRWRKAADFRPPFEFFADILDRDGVRKRLLARLGPDAADPLDEFLDLALTYDDGAPPSLAGFLAFMREGERDIKRDMEHGRNEVRVMTVHGAKGLEAPIVFLPDTCGAGSGPRGGRPIPLDAMERPSGAGVPFAWPVSGSSTHPAIQAARAELARDEGEERNRLLYVAMTRARDRLYVAGFEGKKGRKPGSWYDLIEAGLEGVLTRVTDAEGRALRRLEAPQTVAADTRGYTAEAAAHTAPPPAWIAARAPREAQLTVPLAPSRLDPYETDDEGEPLPTPPPLHPRDEPAALSPSGLAGDNRFLRGTLTHALLEHLPQIVEDARQRVADAFLAERARGLPERTRKSIVREVLALLSDPAFGAVFAPGSRAEVPVVAVIPRPEGAGCGPPLRIAGQIDRLAVTDDAVLIVDYKTNRSAPVNQAGVASVYLYQLAAYRLAVRDIFPERAIRAALLWTEKPYLMEISEEILDTHAADLWHVDSLRLDA